jgi:hypothetical protein
MKTYWDMLRSFSAPGAKPSEPKKDFKWVDARATHWVTLCSHLGDEYSFDGAERCKHFNKSDSRSCCMYYRSDENLRMCDKIGDK